MTKYLLLGLLFFLISKNNNAQVLNRLKSKTREKTEQVTDKMVDQAISTPANTPPAQAKPIPPVQKDSQSLIAYSKFDFIPGDKILSYEDFASDPVGELPISWNASGKGELQTFNSQTGKWLRLFQNVTYLSGNKNHFGENYTLEFDLLYYFNAAVPNYVLPGWYFGMFSSKDADPTANSFLKDRSAVNSVEIKFDFGSNGLARLESREKYASTFRSDKIQLPKEGSGFNMVRHYSIQVQKSRIRLWSDQTKVLDIPRAINTGSPLNGLFFQFEGSNYKDEEIGLFISNIKVATGQPDTRHRLMEEGRLSTTGILFDVNSDRIKPNSYAVLKEIAAVLQQNPSLKIKITGHTDSDGDAKSNQLLSEKRAAAVKTALIKEFTIAGERMSTDGKGQSQPVVKGASASAKAANRRVEFIKL